MGLAPIFIMESGKRDIEQHYSINSAAKLLDVCNRTIRREIKRKELRISRVSGRIRIPASQLLKILNNVDLPRDLADEILSRY